MFQHLYDFPLSTNQLIKKIGFQLYFGSCLLIVRSCLRGWEPEETPLSARVSRSLSVSVRGRSLWSKIVLLLPVEEVMWWWKWRGGAEKGVRSWEGEVTLEAIAHSGSHKHTETHNPGHIRERIKLFYSSNKTGNSAKETLDSRLLMQTVQTATLVNKEWFFAFVKHHLTGCIVSNVGTHNLKHYYLLCIYRCVFSVFWATVHWVHDFLPSYRLLESFVLYLALMIMPWNVEYNPLPSDSGLWHQWVKAHLRLDIKFTVSVSSACHVTLKVE